MAAEDLELDGGDEEESLELDTSNIPEKPPVIVGTPDVPPPPPPVATPPPRASAQPRPEGLGSNTAASRPKNVDVPYGKAILLIAGLAAAYYFGKDLISPGVEGIWEQVDEAIVAAGCQGFDKPFRITIATIGTRSFAQAHNTPDGARACLEGALNALTLPVDENGDVTMLGMQLTPQGGQLLVPPIEDRVIRKFVIGMRTTRVVPAGPDEGELDDVFTSLHPAISACLSEHAFSGYGSIPGGSLYNEIPHMLLTLAIDPNGRCVGVGHDSAMFNQDWRSSPALQECMNGVLMSATWPAPGVQTSVGTDLNYKIRDF